MKDNPLIQARNVCRNYGNRRAIDQISFTVKRGEIVTVLGPNGAGKSTLMQILCGVLAASSGKVEIAGHDIVERPLSAKSHLGYLPEPPPLYADSTVDEYLHYCARLHAVPSNAIADSITACKQACGLTDTGKRLINNLSKGYRQRVGIAQAIIHSPDVIVLDEPGSGVDPNQMIEIRELIRSLGKTHSVILSTHNLAEAQSVSDRVLIIHAGRIVLDRDRATLGDRLEQTYLELTQDKHALRAARS